MAKLRAATECLGLAALGRCARAWRVAAVAERARREAAAHLEVRLREQRLLAVATDHHTRRRAKRAWLSWSLHVYCAHGEQTAAALHEQAARFLDGRGAQDVASPCPDGGDPSTPAGSPAPCSPAGPAATPLPRPRGSKWPASATNPWSRGRPDTPGSGQRSASACGSPAAPATPGPSIISLFIIIFIG